MGKSPGKMCCRGLQTRCRGRVPPATWRSAQSWPSRRRHCSLRPPWALPVVTRGPATPMSMATIAPSATTCRTLTMSACKVGAVGYSWEGPWRVERPVLSSCLPCRCRGGDPRAGWPGQPQAGGLVAEGAPVPRAPGEALPLRPAQLQGTVLSDPAPRLLCLRGYDRGTLRPRDRYSCLARHLDVRLLGSHMGGAWAWQLRLLGTLWGFVGVQTPSLGPLWVLGRGDPGLRVAGKP